MCPDCGSLNLAVAFADFGRSPETGYPDAGEQFRCLDCGARGPAEDAEPAPIRKPAAREAGAGAVHAEVA